MTASSDSSRANRVALMVLGMHRSGTSALTRVLNLLGVDLGSDLMQATGDNEKGYWEHNGIVQIHEAILSRLDREWSDIGPLPEDWTGYFGVPEQLDRLARLIEREFGAKRLWGVKDPRLCELLAGWRPILDSLGVEPRCAIVVRNPLEVADSLMRRDGIARPRALSMWLRYLLDSELHSRGLRRAFVSYDSLMQDWRAEVGRLGTELRLSWPRSVELVRDSVESFLDPTLRHFKSERVGQETSPLLRSAYSALVACDWIDCTDLRAAFDRFRDELDNSAALPGETLRAVEVDARRRRNAKELELAQRIGELAAENTELRKYVSETEAQRDRLNAALHETQARLGAEAAQRNAAQAQVNRERRLRIRSEVVARLNERRAAQKDRLLETLSARLTEREDRLEAAAAANGERRRSNGDTSALATDPTEVARRAEIFFDPAFYVARYPEAVRTTLTPYAHYLAIGWRAGNRPSLAFDPDFYFASDASSDGACPLTHYLLEGSSHGASPHPLFDPTFYASQTNPGELDAAAPFEHYLTVGWRRGLSPNPLFDPKHYARHAPGSVGRCPLLHYLESDPAAAASPHLLFHPEYYRSQAPAAELGQTPPLVHYLASGWRRNLRPHPLFDPATFAAALPGGGDKPQERLAQYLSNPDRWDLRVHALFDPAHYRAACQAVDWTPVGPLLVDYLLEGAPRKASPHPTFSIDHYFGQVPAARESTLDPVSHYILVGDRQGSAPHVCFDPGFYRDAYGACIPEGASALEHFVLNGDEGGFDPCDWFDARFYAATHLKGQKANPLLHFLSSGLRQGLSPASMLSPADYLASNPDIVQAGLSAVQHWVDLGRLEGRRTISGPRLMSKILSRTPANESAELRSFAAEEIQALRARLGASRIAVLTNSTANFFMTEIAEALINALGAVASDVLRIECGIAPPDRMPEADVYIVPAPHETLTLGAGPQTSKLLDWSRVVVYNTEQAQSQYFSRARPFLKRARLVVDINWQTAALIAAEIRPASAFLPTIALHDLSKPVALPDVPFADGLGKKTRSFVPARDQALDARPFDLSFAGSRTPRRDEFFAKANEVFARYRSFLYFKVPHRNAMYDENEGGAQGALARFFAAISQRSKILLNVHRDDFPFFEWHRIVCLGIAQGAVVVSEPSLPAPLFVAGKHYIEENLRWIPNVVRWLLEDEEGQRFAEKVRRDALEAYEQAFSAEQHGARIVSLIDPYVKLMHQDRLGSGHIANGSR